jgi:small subunit ribosomal protein S6
VPRPYETVIIFDSTLEDSQVQEKIQRLSGLVAPDGGETVKVDIWGKRKLAYPIDKKEQGIYAVLRYETEPSALTEFERIMRLDEQVLRQLTVVDPIVPTATPARVPRPAEESEA